MASSSVPPPAPGSSFSSPCSRISLTPFVPLQLVAALAKVPLPATTTPPLPLTANPPLPQLSTPLVSSPLRPSAAAGLVGHRAGSSSRMWTPRVPHGLRRRRMRRRRGGRSSWRSSLSRTRRSRQGLSPLPAGQTDPVGSMGARVHQPTPPPSSLPSLPLLPSRSPSPLPRRHRPISPPTFPPRLPSLPPLFSTPPSQTPSRPPFRCAKPNPAKAKPTSAFCR